MSLSMSLPSMFLFSLNICPLRKESSRQMQWFSESDVSDIVESDSRPASPVTVPIEAVDGVQPELQHTQKESELVSKSSKPMLKTIFSNQTNLRKCFEPTDAIFFSTFLCMIELDLANSNTHARPNPIRNLLFDGAFRR